MDQAIPKRDDAATSGDTLFELGPQPQRLTESLADDLELTLHRRA